MSALAPRTRIGSWRKSTRPNHASICIEVVVISCYFRLFVLNSFSLPRNRMPRLSKLGAYWHVHTTHIIHLVRSKNPRPPLKRYHPDVCRIPKPGLWVSPSCQQVAQKVVPLRFHDFLDLWTAQFAVEPSPGHAAQRIP